MSKSLKYSGLLLLLSFCANVIQAQNVDWLRSFGGKYSAEQIIACFHNNQTANNVFVLKLNTSSQSINEDTIRFDSIYFTIPKQTFTTSHKRSFIVETNSLGRVTKAYDLGHLRVASVLKDIDNSYYFTANVLPPDTGKIIVLGIDTKLTNSHQSRIIFKIDSNYQLVWSTKLGAGAFYENDHKNLLLDKNSIYTRVAGKGSTVLGDSVYFFNEITNVVCNISRSTGQVIWSKYIVKNHGDSFYIGGFLKHQERIYVYGYAGWGKKFYMANDSIQNSSFILEVDSGSNINSLKKYPKIGFSQIASSGKEIIFSCELYDSIHLNNKIYKPYFPIGLNKPEIAIIRLNQDFSLNWIYQPKILDLTALYGGYVTDMDINADYVYIGTRIYAKTEINNTIFEDFLPNIGDIIVFKMDLLGNVLWVANYNTRGDLYTINAKNNAQVLLGGYFRDDSIQFGKIKLMNELNHYYESFITKLSDNAIIRGYVSNGPYCAGDTFKVPYRKIGDYDTSNYFIAELSDAEGNFNGGQRELGRIKSNQDSVILGKLPLFQVGSSEKYRIRILSTAPAVQSYYKVDTLRLLVYSRDKANPGNDTTICKGDTVLLQTYGGTKWTWSPKYKMKDSSARETKAWPDKTTTYKIIIADSSGCGEADTATKTVFVREGLSVQFHTKTDTAVCLGGSLLVKASFHGGDSMAYNWQWTAIDSKGQYSFPRSGSGKQTDSLLFTMPPGELDSVRLVLSLTDGCTPGSAFSIYTLKIKKSKAQTVFLPGDTAACPGKPLPLIAEFKNGAAALLSWQWQEKNQFNQWLNRQSGSKKQGDTVNYTLPTNWKGLKQWRLILKDNCSGLNDTAIYNISPRDTLKLSLNTGDTILCKGQTYTYKATGKDGYPGGYVFVWTDVNTGDTLSWADSLTLQAESSRQIKVNLTDNCMPNPVSRTINIQVHPALQAAMNLKQDTVLCHGRNLDLTASASGGKGSGYTFQWVLEQKEIGTQDSLQFKSADYFTAPGTKTLYLILNDACSKPADTAQINITVLAPLKVAVNTIDSICYGNSALFKANATGGKGSYTYQWLNENNVLQGNTDSLKLTNTSQTQTSIARKLIVSDGCSKNDTASIQTVFLAPLKITVSTTDSCPAANTTLTATTSGGKAGQHLVTWYNNNNIQIGSGSSILVNPNGSAQTYRAILKDNCSVREDTAYLSIGSKPAVKLSATGVCLGDETNILAKKINTSNALNYQWEINNSPAPETDSILKRKFAAVGTYKIKVSVSAGTACNGQDSTTVEIIHKPKAEFQYVHFQSNGMGIPFKFLNHSQNATHYHWYFGTGDTSQAKSPDYTYRDTGKATVILIASNQNKCFDTATQTLPIYDKIEFYFPNVFSPDGNNINEGFGLHAGQVQFVKEFHLQVYNRWGELVYNSKEASGVWRGEGSQQSVYIWKAEIRDLYNVLHELEGVVELLR